MSNANSFRDLCSSFFWIIAEISLRLLANSRLNDLEGRVFPLWNVNRKILIWGSVNDIHCIPRDGESAALLLFVHSFGFLRNSSVVL